MLSTLLLLAGVLAVACLAVKVWLDRRRLRATRLPCYDGSLPFFGCWDEFAADPEGFLRRLHGKFGNVFSFYGMGKRYVFVADHDAYPMYYHFKPDDMRVTSKAFEYLVGKSNFDVLFGGRGRGDATAQFLTSWQRVFHQGVAAAMMERYVASIHSFAAALLEVPQGETRTVNMFAHLHDLVWRVSVACVAGRRLAEDPNFHKTYRQMEASVALAVRPWTRLKMAVLPWLRDAREARGRVIDMLSSEISARQAGTEGPEDDFLAHLLRSATLPDGTQAPPDAVVTLLLTFLLASTFNVTSCLFWLLCFLVDNDDIRQEVIEEQRRVAQAHAGRVDVAALHAMPLLHACVKETIRLRMGVVGVRAVVRDRVFKDFVFPAGSLLMLSTLFSHFDETIFPNPYVFDPHRFDAGREEGKDARFSFIGFGFGIHKCVGETFAYNEIKTIVHLLLKRFDLSVSPAGVPEVNKQRIFLGMSHPAVFPSLSLVRRAEDRY